MGRKDRRQAAAVTGQCRSDLSQAEAEPTKARDLGYPGNLVGAVSPPSNRRAQRRDKAVPLVKPEGLHGNAYPSATSEGRRYPAEALTTSPRMGMRAVVIEPDPGPGQARQ